MGGYHDSSEEMSVRLDDNIRILIVDLSKSFYLNLNHILLELRESIDFP